MEMFEQAAGLVVREVRSGQRAGRATRVVVASRAYRTDRADLWAALTDPDRIPRWFAPVAGDLVEGGHYRIEGNASGTIERCERPEGFALTWEMGEQTSWVTVTLTPDGAGTTLALTHESLPPPDFWSTYGPGAVGVGWDLALLGLDLHVASGEPVPVEVATGFHTMPGGPEFIRAVADGWAAAAITHGEDEEPARAAAQATYAFYTGT